LGFFFVATTFNYCCSSRDDTRRIAANIAKLLEILMSQLQWR